MNFNDNNKDLYRDIASVRRKIMSKKHSYFGVPDEKVPKRKRKHGYKTLCDKKILPSKDAADMALYDHKLRVLQSTMNIYWCLDHTSYHLGHNRRMSRKEILDMDKQFAQNLRFSTNKLRSWQLTLNQYQKCRKYSQAFKINNISVEDQNL